MKEWTELALHLAAAASYFRAGSQFERYQGRGNYWWLTGIATGMAFNLMGVIQ